jgi:hypothetical protein
MGACALPRVLVTSAKCGEIDMWLCLFNVTIPATALWGGGCGPAAARQSPGPAEETAQDAPDSETAFSGREGPSLIGVL